jgi:hypothetical protein
LEHDHDRLRRAWSSLMMGYSSIHA